MTQKDLAKATAATLNETYKTEGKISMCIQERAAACGALSCAARGIGYASR